MNEGAPKGHRHKAWGFNPRERPHFDPSPEGAAAWASGASPMRWWEHSARGWNACAPSGLGEFGSANLALKRQALCPSPLGALPRQKSLALLERALLERGFWVCRPGADAFGCAPSCRRMERGRSTSWTGATVLLTRWGLRLLGGPLRQDGSQPGRHRIEPREAGLTLGGACSTPSRPPRVQSRRPRARIRQPPVESWLHTVRAGSPLLKAGLPRFEAGIPVFNAEVPVFGAGFPTATPAAARSAPPPPGSPRPIC